MAAVDTSKIISKISCPGILSLMMIQSIFDTFIWRYPAIISPQRLKTCAMFLILLVVTILETVFCTAFQIKISNFILYF